MSRKKKILIDIVFDFLRFKMERIRFFLSIFSLDSSNKCLFLSTKLFIKPLIQILNRNIISSISMFWERGLPFFFFFDKPSVTKGPYFLSSRAPNFRSSYQFISISGALNFFPS